MFRKKEKVGVIGLGYVGLPLALLAKIKGYDVTGFDIDKDKVEKINHQTSPFEDENVQKQLNKIKLTCSTDFSLINNMSIVVICVPTPVYEDRTPDYTPVIKSCETVSKYLKKGQLVVLESTVNPGVSEEMMLPILEKRSGLKCGTDFYLAHCPERINPGDKKWNVSNIPRVVGGFDKKSLEMALIFYQKVINATIKPMGSLKEAEAVKVTENSFRNINIAFVNELAKSFDKLGIDVVNVIDGAATKPFSFLAHYPSCGIGGHCIPVDPYYLIDYAAKNGFNHRFLKMACSLNESMPEYTVELLEKSLKKEHKKISGSKIALLGLSYKADIDDCRESPSFEIIKILKSKGAKVITYDPHVKSLSLAQNLEEAVQGTDAVIIATSHSVFVKEISQEFVKRLGVKIIIDGKNCLKIDQFMNSNIKYHGIGRQ